MHRTLIALLAMLPLWAATGRAQLSLEQCHERAYRNYPLLARYDLVNQTKDYTMANLRKGYLPRLSLNASASYQSDVAALPDVLTGLMEQNGYPVDGMRHDRYKVGIDVKQTLYDGGNIKARSRLAERDADVQTAGTDVEMYALRHRVNQLFFGVLLLDEQLRLNEEWASLLESNLRKMEAMQRSGVAMESDVAAVKAEILNARQQRTSLTSGRNSYARMLAIFIGEEESLPPLLKPSADEPGSLDNRRPELLLFDARLRQAEAGLRTLSAGLRPEVSLFMNGWYGYPGLDMFADMRSGKWSLNGIVGLQFTWNISRLYTFKNDKVKISLSQSIIENEREVFLFNNNLQTMQVHAAIGQYREMMQRDDEIVRLRTTIREAAEAKLAGGVIDSDLLLREITAEHRAAIDRAVHEVEMLRNIYELKHNINQ